MRISDWSSDVCSSDLRDIAAAWGRGTGVGGHREEAKAGMGNGEWGTKLASARKRCGRRRTPEPRTGCHRARGNEPPTSSFTELEPDSAAQATAARHAGATLKRERKSTRLNSSH